MKRISIFLTILSLFIGFGAQAQIPSFLSAGSAETLKGGIEYKKYSGKYETKVSSDPDNPYDMSQFSYEIEWPVSGPTQVVSEIRKKIVSIIKDGAQIQTPAPTASNLQQIINTIIPVQKRNDKGDDCGHNREININLVSNGSAVTVNGSTCDIVAYANGFPYVGSRSVYRISDGKKFTKAMLPSWDQLRILVAANFYQNDERQSGGLGGDGMYGFYDLPAPNLPPIFDEDKITFEYWVYEIGSGADGFFRGEVDYSDIAELASPEFKTFLPKNVTKSPDDVLISFNTGGLVYKLKDNGIVSCLGNEIGSWNKSSDDPEVLIIYAGHPNGDGAAGYIYKNGRVYYVTAGSEEFEIEYDAAKNEVYEIWNEDEDEKRTHRLSSLESWPATKYGEISDFSSEEGPRDERLYEVAQSLLKEDPKYSSSQVDEIPVFRGSLTIQEWIKEHLQRNASVDFPDLKGGFFIQLLISKSGIIEDVVFPGSISNESDRTKIKETFKSMPLWSPAWKDGEIVRCLYPIQVFFNVDGAVRGIGSLK